MNIRLDPTYEKIVNSLINSGLYRDADEVVRDGVRQLQQRDLERADRLAALRAEIQVGIDQIDNGQFKPFSADEIKREGRKLLKARRKAS